MSAPTPVFDFLKRGEVARDVRLMAAQGGLATRALEQMLIIVHLRDDPDPEIRAAAGETLDRVPVEALQAFLGRSDIPVGLREFFADRGVFPAEIPAIEVAADATNVDDPLIDTSSSEPEQDGNGKQNEDGKEDDRRESVVHRIASMGFTDRLKAAVKGTREMRSILIRDTNKMIASAVLSSPKVSEAEIESFAKMANVSDEVLRTIANNRAWMKNYGIVVALTKNPKTPLAMSMRLMSRLNDRDMTQLSNDRNVPEPLRVAARKRVVANTSGH